MQETIGIHRDMPKKNRLLKFFKIGFIVFFVLIFINNFYHWAANFEKNKNITNKKIPSTSKKINEKHVLADFYYWYDMPTGAHSEALTDHPTYSASYKNQDWFKKQFQDMHEAGIDIALLVYWSKYDTAYLEGLQNMVKSRENLIKSGMQAPKIGLFLDTGIYGRVPKAKKDLTSIEGKEYFYYLIKEFYQNIPKNDWGRIDGKPVVWLWGNYFNILFDQSSFDYIYNHFQQDFGVLPYIVREESWNYPLRKGFFIAQKSDFTNPIFTDDVYRWGAELSGFYDAGGNIASVGPGYDERQLTGSDRTGRIKDRQNGKFYEESFQKALNSEKNLINIETWNEFHEASDIADSVEYGRKYIDITKNYTNKFFSK